MCKINNSKFNNTLASITIFLSVVTLLALCIIWGSWLYHNLKDDHYSSHIEIKFAQDSVLHIAKEDSQALVDSLSNIMFRHEQILSNKYRYIIKKRALEDSLFSMGSIIIAIVISICGFFGFKSFQSIEEKAKEAKEAADKAAKEAADKAADKAAKEAADKAADKAAKEAADKAAKEAADKAANSTQKQIDNITQKYLDNNVSTLVDVAIKKDQEKIIENIITNVMNNDMIPKISDADEKFTDQIKKIKTIENDIENIKIQIDKIAQKNDIDINSSSQTKENNNQTDKNIEEEPKNKFLKEDK